MASKDKLDEYLDELAEALEIAALMAVIGYYEVVCGWLEDMGSEGFHASF
jgi:hypothetical protein